MPLLKAEMELITAPCPLHLAARPSTFPLWGVFSHRGVWGGGKVLLVSVGEKLLF